MTKHHWTPEAVHELVKDWPDEARAAIGWAPESSQWVQFDCSPMLSYLAAAAHVASGAEKLAGNRAIEIIKTNKDYAVWIGLRRYSGKTMLHAIALAMAATMDGAAEAR